jgi:hypothetical protein
MNVENAKEFFFEEQLKKHGQYLVSLLKEDIGNKDIIDSANLQNSLSYKVEKVAGNFQLSIIFKGYGRVLEMNQNKKKTANIESSEDTKAKFKISDKKDYQWYSKNAYGSLNSLYSAISYGFSEEEVKRIKNVIASSADGTTLKNIKV